MRHHYHLIRGGEDVYNKDLFINKNSPFMFNKEITEYDMKEGGYSIIREYKLLSKKVIDELGLLSKQERTIKIGMLMRDNKDLGESMKNGFKLARKMFFEENGIEKNDIISIKKDAVFTNKPFGVNKFGDYIEFREKNKYTSYIYLGKNLEFYYSPSHLDIKGISENKIKLHDKYFVDTLRSFFYKSETRDASEVLDWFRRFIDKYKRKELDIGYYRTFDPRSVFELYTNTGDIMEFDRYLENDKDDINIDYNFRNILLKLIKIPL